MCCRRRVTDSPVMLTETANSAAAVHGRGSVARCFIVSSRSYGLILATVCGLDYWFACYHNIHRYVALSVIGHRMCNRISGLCDKSSITIDTKRYRETSLVCCLRYYYSCCALVIIWGNQLVIFPGIALYYGNTSLIYIYIIIYTCTWESQLGIYAASVAAELHSPPKIIRKSTSIRPTLFVAVHVYHPESERDEISISAPPPLLIETGVVSSGTLSW